MTPYLLLIDMDGTLVKAHGGGKEAARCQAANEIFGTDLSIEDFYASDPWGKTDALITREMLAHKGLSTIDEVQLQAWSERACEIFCAHDEQDLLLLNNVAETLPILQQQGHILAMLTGNLAPMAWHRLSQLGIDHYFERGQGAFGSDGEDRNTYVKIALERANRTAQEAIVIGDTIRDIACARAGGAHCIAVATGTTTAEHLHTADKVIDSFDQLPTAIASL